MVRDEEKKELKLFLLYFFHPTSCMVQCHLWEATIPTHVAVRSGSRLTLAGGAPAGRRRDPARAQAVRNCAVEVYFIYSIQNKLYLCIIC